MLSFAFEEAQPGGHLLGVALGAERFFSLLAAAINVHFEEIEQFDDHAGSEERDGFFRISGIALRAVNELATGAIREFDLRGDAVRERELARSWPGGLRGDLHRLGIEHEAHVIKEMEILPI